MAAYRTSKIVLVATFLVYAVLVATHLGEFWPFSIYPMFSKGGQPWSRAIVREVPDSIDSTRWSATTVEDLPGLPFGLREHGIDPIDLSNFVSKTKVWTPARTAGLHHMFYDQVDERTLLVMRVNGRLVGEDSVQVEFVPYAMLAADTTVLNPQLR